MAQPLSRRDMIRYIAALSAAPALTLATPAPTSGETTYPGKREGLDALGNDMWDGDPYRWCPGDHVDLAHPVHHDHTGRCRMGDRYAEEEKARWATL